MVVKRRRRKPILLAILVILLIKVLMYISGVNPPGVDTLFRLWLAIM